MAKRELDPVNFCKIFDIFGEKAAKDTYDDVKEGRIKESTVEKYLYDDTETKEQYEQRLKKEFEDL